MKKTATLPTLQAWLRARYRGQIEVDDNSLRIADRESAGDDSPPEHLMKRNRELAAQACAEFANVRATVEAIDEWADLALEIVPTDILR